MISVFLTSYCIINKFVYMNTWTVTRGNIDRGVVHASVPMRDF